MENWLAVIVGIYLIGMILYGHYKGFIRLAVSVAALVLTLIIVNTAMPVVTEYLLDQDVVYQFFENGMKKAAGIEADIQAEGPSEQRMIIENLNLPEQLKQALLENNNNEVYHMLGVDRFMDYIIRFLANRFINIACFVVLLILVSILLHIIVRWLDLVARLPILHGMNKVAGAVLGGGEALLVLWILCLILPLFSGTHIGMELMNQIGASKFLTFLYDNNILNVLILNAVQGLL